MLQNRVGPFGNIIKTSARGAWMGNRGLLHNEHQQILRPFKLKAWITCVLEFRGRKRQVMAPGKYTELFFLDEATAFAAGHRPCFECRRDDAMRFKLFWLKGNPEYGFDEKTPIGEIDKILHKERINGKGEKVTYEEAISNIPDGTFILLDDKPFLLANNTLFAYAPLGYGKGRALLGTKKLMVLTPRSIINAFRAGYIPEIAIDK
ncbi:MAG TPA: hypothetical protein VN721_08570 [Flavipsychrobacter sp.]|nr:hypothetical protein [Flavipsychrobacter sp.]